MGAKIPQQSSSRPRLHPAATPYRKLLKTRRTKAKDLTPVFIRAHIQLAGCGLTNNHTFKLLSGLLRQTLSKKNIAFVFSSVNLKPVF
jgi:hypothetical protein